MKKAHVLAEHPTDPEQRIECFIWDQICFQFEGNEFLVDVELARDHNILQPIEYMGRPIRFGHHAYAGELAPDETLADFVVGNVQGEAERLDIPCEVTPLG